MQLMKNFLSTHLNKQTGKQNRLDLHLTLRLYEENQFNEQKRADS